MAERGGTDSWTFTIDISSWVAGEHSVRARCNDSISYSEVEEITLVVEQPGVEYTDGNDSLIPGFGLVHAIVSIGIITILSRRRGDRGAPEE